MRLYNLGQIQSTQLPPKDVIDADLRTGCSRPRRLAKNEHNHNVLPGMMKNDTIAAIDELYRDHCFASPLLSMRLLTI